MQLAPQQANPLKADLPIGDSYKSNIDEIEQRHTESDGVESLASLFVETKKSTNKYR